MKKNYIIDLIFIFLSVLLAYLLVERPAEVNDRRQPAAIPKTGDAKGKTPDIAALTAAKSPNRVDARDIFSGGADVIPAAPKVSYTLTGVVYGRERKAIFKDDAGNVLSVGEGEKLADGSVVKSIDRLLVKAKKGKEEMEYRIFKVEGK